MKTTITNPETAYVLSSIGSELDPQEQVIFNKFISLLNSCDIEVTIDTQFPRYENEQQYDFYFINLHKLSTQQTIPNSILQLVAKSKVVLFNALHDEFNEKLALMAGIQGIFYIDDRPDIILKGLDSIKNNDRWFKRQTMNLALAELLKTAPSGKYKNGNDPESGDSLANLTKREKTIINLVSSGAQNKEIANKLNISPNTVKTHIYSIFRKTSSRNRIELIAWSHQYQLTCFV